MLAFVATLFLTLAIVTSALNNDNLLVKTTQGLIQGHINEAGIREWKGIPYAQPPQGDLRWEYPLPAKPFDSVYQANFNAAGCPQTCKLPPGNCPEYGTSEDCLYLTVFAPTEPAKNPAGYPVFFWIHGGAFEQGLGNCALYNGTNFAQKDIVTVVINYRLGALGFMASKSQKGNYGFMDQRLALEWTKANIAGFGGNPNHITIGGQSAGAMSVGSHLVSPNSKGLFQHSLMESNPLGLPFHTRESATANADNVFTYLGCAADDIACMKAKPVDAILDAQDHAIKLDFDTLLLNFLPFAPMVEPGGEIPVQPFDGLRDAAFPSMPMLQGSVYDEGQLFVFELFTKPVGKVAYEGIVAAVFGAKKSVAILEKYPYDLIPGNTDAREVLNVLATDLLFYCPLRNMTRGYQQVYDTTVMPTYTYRFKHIESFDCWGPDYTFCVGYVCHGSELPFVFNVFNDGVSIYYEPTADEKTLTGDMANAWSNFIATGNPNLGLPIPKNYPLYKQDTDVVLVLDEPDYSIQSHVRTTYCDLWDKLGYFY